MPLSIQIRACWPARSWIGTMDCDAIRGRLDVLDGPHTWCGESSHAAIYPDSGMVATAVSSEDPSSETWMSSSAPTHGAGESSHAAIYPDSGMVATAISSEDPSSSVDVAYTERAHGRALVRARGTCAYGTAAGALARARGTCAHGTNRIALREAAPARPTGGERERSRAVERGGAAER